MPVAWLTLLPDPRHRSMAGCRGWRCWRLRTALMQSARRLPWHPARRPQTQVNVWVVTSRLQWEAASAVCACTHNQDKHTHGHGHGNLAQREHNTASDSRTYLPVGWWKRRQLGRQSIAARCGSGQSTGISTTTTTTTTTAAAAIPTKHTRRTTLAVHATSTVALPQRS